MIKRSYLMEGRRKGRKKCSMGGAIGLCQLGNVIERRKSGNG
jgi:hypothetical protein